MPIRYIQYSTEYLGMKLVVMSKLMHEPQVSEMGFDVIAQMKTFNAETQQTCSSQCLCRVALLRGNGHGIRPQQLRIVAFIDKAQSYNSDIVCSLSYR